MYAPPSNELASSPSAKVFHIWRESQIRKYIGVYLRRVRRRTVLILRLHRLDLIKSYIQDPRDYHFSSVVDFIVEDRNDELLRGINEFVKTVDHTRIGRRSLSQVFAVLASPPTDIDLSPLIDYFSRHPHSYTWRETSDTIIAYLTSFPLSQFSDSTVENNRVLSTSPTCSRIAPNLLSRLRHSGDADSFTTAVRRFLQLCVRNAICDVAGYWFIIGDDTRSRARDLLTELNTISSSTGAIASTSIRSASPSHWAPHDPTPNTSSQPDSLLSPSIDSISAAPENIADDTVPFADPNSDMNTPMLTLNHPPPVIASTEPVSDALLAPDSQAAFDRSPDLENAHRED
ncbi:hypothetical protein SISNIDRAFT_469653 [Sistotremastrum niveocremeum HHB9708]|uniref:Uncharacterized protein n=1 Tax=Sistotremastrum niveocremeum HHB9708 TaxID=1314777 RepID=A0A164PQK3_9AGAM|nr:hypothetical protein SISNIDRAFT_469653 [Sistotremastrum niveocremeum HHB9708]